jgi:DNA-directed RNA polymerase specialized sigma24 family protein
VQTLSDPSLTAMKLCAEDSTSTRQSLLVRLKQLDDKTSWREFFETYWELIYNFARKASLNDAEAQEVVQETVIAVARKIGESFAWHWSGSKRR